MAVSTWKQIPAAGDAPGFRVFEGELEKPSLDDRQYRVLELHNGLRAVVVHDPAADKAAACLALTVGYMLDPVRTLAYLHRNAALFANGGSRNAATGPTYTEYWFSISPAELSGGLSRLAAFFYAPLFTESLTSREINAVDSEFKRNLQNDGRRVGQVVKSLSIPGHPWARFGTGNYESLSEAARRASENASEDVVLRETRRRLVEWWKEQYCASRMMLAVIGRESLDELTSLVVPSFSKIPNRGLDPRPAFKDDIWSPEHMGTVVFIQTVKDYHAFSLSFQLPDLRQHYSTKPASFLAHFLGHEGPGSICAYLKKKGWLLDLNAGPSGSSRGVQLFKLHVHYRDVLRTVFDYVSLLRASPLEPYHFAEVSTMAATRFRFKEKTQPHSYASMLAHALAEPYPPEWLLSGAHLYRDWDEELVRRVLEGFVPQRARATLEAKTHMEDVLGNDVKWQTEKWYGTPYAVKNMEDTLVSSLSEPVNPELHLPAPNPFIPDNLYVDKGEACEPPKDPTLVSGSDKSQLWHKKDDQFWVPKAHVRLDIKSPLSYATARHAMLTRLLVDLVEDALAELTYDASLAGLSYSVVNQIEGLTVSVGGFSDKIHVLLRTVLEKLCELRVQPDRLRVFREKIKRQYENFYIGQPSSLSESYATWMFMPTVWTPEQKLPELSSITQSDIERHRDDLLAKVFIEALVNGNMTREQSMDILHLAEECLNSRPLIPTEVPRQRSLVLPPGSDVVSRRRHANPKEVNSSLSYYLQVGEAPDVKLRCTLALIAHMMREPCYSTLRTEEQLGYVVASSQWSVNGTLGLGIRIQSTRAPWFLESRVDAFLETFGARLSSMRVAQFEAHKEGLVVKKLERVKDLGEETARFWGHIRSGYYDFVRHETDASVIRELPLEEVVRTYDALVRPSSGSQTRRKLSVHLASQQLHEEPPPTPSPAEPPQATLKVTLVAQGIAGSAEESTFKAGLTCAPAAIPVISAAFGEYGQEQFGRVAGSFHRGLWGGAASDILRGSENKKGTGGAPVDTNCAASKTTPARL
ncbi:LuxS/MPP-like metallohydrolase [Trametes punicea]|nr:LuxS/MPP-like metallohydrolase [Trametes punicea]